LDKFIENIKTNKKKIINSLLIIIFSNLKKLKESLIKKNKLNKKKHNKKYKTILESFLKKKEATSNKKILKTVPISNFSIKLAFPLLKKLIKYFDG
jgi:hypothetical protein